MDFITAGHYKSYLARMFQFDWEKVSLIMIGSAVLFMLVYTITQWKYLKLSGLLICILLGIYMGCVAGVTLYNRAPTGVHSMNLDLFWSYKSYLADRNTIRLVEDVCNIAMFFPFGLMVPLLLRWTRSFIVFLVYDIAFTVFIETAQYYTTRGLFELDDIFNNTVGGIIGFMVFQMGFWIWCGLREMRRRA